jgi:hypothetical protein
LPTLGSPEPGPLPTRERTDSWERGVAPTRGRGWRTLCLNAAEGAAAAVLRHFQQFPGRSRRSRPLPLPLPLVPTPSSTSPTAAGRVFTTAGPCAGCCPGKERLDARSFWPRCCERGRGSLACLERVCGVEGGPSLPDQSHIPGQLGGSAGTPFSGIAIGDPPQLLRPPTYTELRDLRLPYTGTPSCSSSWFHFASFFPPAAAWISGGEGPPRTFAGRMEL